MTQTRSRSRSHATRRALSWAAASLAPGALCAASVGVALPAEPARACSAPACVASTYVGGDSPVVPSTVPAFLLVGGMAFASGAELVLSPDEVSLIRLDDGAAMPIRVEPATAFDGRVGRILVRPEAPLTPGARYALTTPDLCARSQGVVQPRTSTVLARAEAPLPTRLGTLREDAAYWTGGSIPVATFDGSCTRSAPIAAKTVALDLDVEAQPWADALDLSVTVDGEPWSTPSFTGGLGPTTTQPVLAGPGTIVYRVCDEDWGLANGPHTVVMKATLPGSDVSLSSPPLEVTIDCSTVDPGPRRVDGGLPATPTPPTRDDGGVSTIDPRAMDGEGCTVASVGRGVTTSGWVLVLVGLVAALARRRRL
ncbi:MAG: hypothetical protein IT379_30695 [Deltaproteobacteria bacterium]|nr:hypothetical protein [Deltaproteobacteria bacterium]